MNFHAHMVQTLKKTSKATHHSTIVDQVDGILKTIEDLMEDPLFIDGIHGEQELSLDLAVELFSGIRSSFIPLNVTPKASPAHEAGSIDVS